MLFETCNTSSRVDYRGYIDDRFMHLQWVKRNRDAYFLPIFVYNYAQTVYLLSTILGKWAIYN